MVVLIVYAVFLQASSELSHHVSRFAPWGKDLVPLSVGIINTDAYKFK